MNATKKAMTSKQPHESIVRECHHLLADELDQVQHVHGEIRALREAILRSDPATLALRIEQQAALLGSLDRFGRRRLELREQIAREFNTDVEEATLGRLLSSLAAPTRDPLANQCRQVEAAVRSLEADLLATVVLIRNKMEVFDRLLQMLTGQSEPVQRYLPGGMAPRGACGGILHRRC
jgi:flagellar biosynthesis/type III secretory pathway chaperone